MATSIAAHRAGTISMLSMGSLSGSVGAVEDNNPGSGTASGISVGSVTGSGTDEGRAVKGSTAEHVVAGKVVPEGEVGLVGGGMVVDSRAGWAVEVYDGR